jgi:ATP synthase protein I
MADDARDGGNREGVSAEEAALFARLQRLGARLGQVRASRPRENGSDAGATTNAVGFARGFRLSAELVGAVLFGAALGWALDRWLGISPWGLIVFLLLGFAAGVLNVVRAAGVAPNQGSNDPTR